MPPRCISVILKTLNPPSEWETLVIASPTLRFFASLEKAIPIIGAIVLNAGLRKLLHA